MNRGSLTANPGWEQVVLADISERTLPRSRHVFASLATLTAGAVIAIGLPALSPAQAGNRAALPPCGSGNICMTVVVDNQNTGIPAGSNTLYVTLFAGAGPTTLYKPGGTSFAVGTSVPFADLVPTTGGRSAQFTIETSRTSPLASGRLYFSEADLKGGQPAVNVPYRYDYVEFTINSNSTVNGDVTGIDQVGMPARMQFLKADGTVASAGDGPATRTMGCWDDILTSITNAAAVLDPPWTTNINLTVDGTATGPKLRLAGPSALPEGYAGYPSMREYILQMSGNKVTVSGYFGGTTKPPIPWTYYNYSGTFDKAGNLALSGTLTTDKAGGTVPNPSYKDPKTIYLPGAGFYSGQGGTSWFEPGVVNGESIKKYGTGFGVYGQNGSYQLGGTQPANTDAAGSWEYTQGNGKFLLSIGNDIYGWIYGDLIASMANGFLGPLGYDTSVWNTNGNRVGTPYAAPQKAFSALYTPSTLPKYAAWDLWQQAVSTTSDSYGVGLGDRFNFQGAQSASPDMGSTDPVSTIAVTILPKDGCAAAASLEPSPQSLVLSVAGGLSGNLQPTPAVIVLPQGQQPPTGVFHDFVTLTGINFTPTSFTLDKALPAGMRFNTRTGVISGRPTVAMGRSSYTITGTDGSVHATAVVNITTGGDSITPSSQALVGNVAKSLKSPSFAAAGFTSAPTYAIDPALPAGLKLDPATGVISGTPMATQLPTIYSVTASDDEGTAHASVTLSVLADWSIAPGAQTVSGTVGKALTPSTAFTETGFVASPTYTISPQLPAGLTIDAATGIIRGTPTEASAPTTYAVTATGAEGSAHAAILVTVSASTPTPAPTPTPSPISFCSPASQTVAGTVGSALSTSPLSIGAPAPVFVLANGSAALPNGLSGPGYSTGVISGTPTTAGTTTVQIHCQGQSGYEAFASVTLAIAAQSTPTPAPTPTPTPSPGPACPPGTVPVWTTSGALCIAPASALDSS
jgi:hypothetical protein